MSNVPRGRGATSALAQMFWRQRGIGSKDILAETPMTGAPAGSFRVLHGYGPAENICLGEPNRAG
jgi:hypothetical protein